MRTLLHQLGCTVKTAEEFEAVCPLDTKEQLSVFYRNHVLENAKLLMKEGISLGTCLWWMILYPKSFTRHSMFFSASIREIKDIAKTEDLFFLEKQFVVELQVPAIAEMHEREGYKEKLQLFAKNWNRYLNADEDTEKEQKMREDLKNSSWEIYKGFYDKMLLRNGIENPKTVTHIEEPVRWLEKDAEPMETETAEAPIPYDGEEPFVFISYSHQDNDKVFPIIRRLQEAHYRVWFDKGIKGGREWAQEVAKRIRTCGCFISFVSPEFVQSEHCLDEFHWAKTISNYSSMVFLQETKLEDWMDMQSGRWQRVYKHKEAEEVFYQKLFDFNGLEKCYDQTSSRRGKDRAFFDRAFSGTSAEGAWKVCKDFADETEGVQHVYIHGDSASDKLYLKQGARKLLQGEVLSIVAADWINAFISAMHRGNPVVFQEEYKACDWLIIDDLESICGKTSVQEELYRILKYRFEEDKPYLLFSTEDLTKKPSLYRPLQELLKAGKVVSV